MGNMASSASLTRRTKWHERHVAPLGSVDQSVSAAQWPRRQLIRSPWVQDQLMLFSSPTLFGKVWKQLADGRGFPRVHYTIMLAYASCTPNIIVSGNKMCVYRMTTALWAARKGGTDTVPYSPAHTHVTYGCLLLTSLLIGITRCPPTMAKDTGYTTQHILRIQQIKLTSSLS